MSGGLPYAPWCRPKFRRVAPGVEVMDVYGQVWAGNPAKYIRDWEDAPWLV